MNVPMTQQFINDYIKCKYDERIIEITKDDFDKRISDNKAECVYAYKYLDLVDHNIHPLQKIYVVCDFFQSYESGMQEWGFEFVFKYKGKYYTFMNYGGN